MARKPATLQLSSNIEGNFSAPLDGRMKVTDLEELTAEGSFPFPYRGLLTYVESEQKWYTLRYDDPTNISSWAEMTQGADGKDGLNVSVDSVSKQGRENTVTFVWKDPDGSDKSIDMVVLDGMKGDRGEPGERGEKGDDGRSFSVQAQYSSEEAMREAHPTGSEGDAYLVENETDTPDLWYWNVEESDWYCYGPLAGARGERGEPGPTGFSPDITVAETSDGSYKLRVTTANGSFVTPNLQGNLAPQDRIDTSANPVQSGTIKTALDAKQDKTLATAVGVRDYATKNIVNQTTVQTTLEALAAAVNYMEIPSQMITRVASESDLPQNAKPGSICLVGEEGETPIAYVCSDDGSWEKIGGANSDVMVEITEGEIDAIWNNTTAEVHWVSGATLPESFCDHAACVYNGKLHILGGLQNKYSSNQNEKNGDGAFHFQLNNGVWEELPAIPLKQVEGCVVYDNKIFIFGSTKVYTWDGNEWSEFTSLPYVFSEGSVVIYNDEIHLLGTSSTYNANGTTGMANQTNHYKWNGEAWVSVSSIPMMFYGGGAVVFDGKIHIFGGYANNNRYYTWDGNSWTREEDLPTEAQVYEVPVVVYDNKINIIKGYRYELVGNTITKKEFVTNQNLQLSQATVLGRRIYLTGGVGNYTRNMILE